MVVPTLLFSASNTTMDLREGWSELSRDQLVDIISSALKGKQPHPSQINSTHISPIGIDRKLAQSSPIEHNRSFIKEDTSCCKQNSPLTPVRQSEISIPFALPIDIVIRKLNEIQNLATFLGNKDKRLNNWNNTLISTCDSILTEFLNEKEKISNDFVKSLETITKIFSITSKFSPIESINESALTPTIRNLIFDYKSNTLKSLESYCNEDLSMFELNKDVERNLIRLIPILSQQLLSFNKQLKLFYSLYEMIDDTNHEVVSDSFLSNLPTKSEISQFNEINEAIDIKLILQTNFNKINPSLIEELDVKILKLSDHINEKLDNLRSLIINVTKLNNELFISSDPQFLHLPSFIDDNDMLLNKLGIKTEVFDEYHKMFNSFQEIKNERERLLNEYLHKVEQLWSILRPNSNEIQNFLKINKNIQLKSLDNFEQLLSELEKEKLVNMKKFINIAREKIKGYWDILMYDDESKLNFKDFYIDNEDFFDEELLNSHSNEVNRLRSESENLKPLLNLIGELDELLLEKKQLDESSKDPTRLLKRNSFKILKQEEITRSKLTKELPALISKIKSEIKNFEMESGRFFKLNGELYVDKLEEIENSFKHKKRNTRTNFRSPTISPNIRKNSALSSTKRSKNLVTPSRSVIRRRDPTQMSNPFLSRNPTPSKPSFLNTPSNVTKRNHLSAIRPVLSSSASVLSTNKKSPLSSDSLSNEPIILRGRSPVKNNNLTLNLNASTKINTHEPLQNFESSKSSKDQNSSRRLHQNIKKSRNSPASSFNRSPMGLISNTFNNNDNQFSIYSNSRPNRPIDLIHNQNNLNSLANAVSVEELSDSILDYSDNEENKENKENYSFTNELKHKNNITKNKILSFSTTTENLNQNEHKIELINDSKNYNLSLDSDTF